MNPPSMIHELVLDCVTDEVKEQLKTITRNDGPSGTFASQVACVGSSQVEAGTKPEKSEYSPDKPFIYRSSRGSNVIIEIAYAQTELS